MRTVQNLMGSGCSPTLAGLLGKDPQHAVAAAGSVQATATPITAALCRVTTATTATADGLRLPSAGTFQGESIAVINDTAVVLDVFPAVGETINAGAANVAVTVAATSIKKFYNMTATNWAAY